MSAINKVKLWSESFPNFNIQEHFGPMNMAKTWVFSEKNIAILRKRLTMLQDDFYLKKDQMLFLIDGELPKEKIMMENFDQVKN